MLRSKRSRSTVGLDIQADRISAAQVTVDQSSEPVLYTAAIAEGLVRNGEVVDVAGLTTELKEFFKEHQLPRSVRIGIANPRVVVRTVDIPVLKSEEERDAAVKFTAGELLPIPIEEAVFDYQVLRQIKDSEGNDRDHVVVVAAPSELVNKYVAAVQGAGLKLAGIDLSAFALIRSLYRKPSTTEEGNESSEFMGDQSAVAYCHIGTVTNVAVAQQSTCTFTRTMPQGITTAEDDLAGRLGCSLQEAHEKIFNIGLTVNDNVPSETLSSVHSVLNQEASKIAHTLRSSLDYYASQEDSALITRTVLTGPALEIDGFVDAINEQFTGEIVCARPNIENVDDNFDPNTFTLAYGLSLDEVQNETG